jgi:rod shape-determining protein MreC
VIVVSLVAASLAIITLDYRAGDRGPLEAAGRAVSSAIAPLQQAVSNVVQPISNFFSTLGDLPSLASRNAELLRELEELKIQAQQNAELQRRIESLEGLLGLKVVRPRSIAARVIASGASNFEWTITIDQGSNAGIQVDMPVVTGTAAAGELVGRVIRVTPVSADVELIIDRSSAVAGELSTSHEAGIVLGQGDRDLRMDLLRTGIRFDESQPESVFTLGYEVNGQPGIYPPGLLIGTVSRAYSDPEAVESFVTIRPAVDFSTLQYVLVLATDRRQKAEL